MVKRKSSAGGAALHGGAAYQNRVAAWLAAEMLAEGSGSPLTTGGNILFIRGETQEDVDDLLVGTSLERHSFLQAKRRISLSDKKDSDFASVIDQAVRQIATSRSEQYPQPWSRRLDPKTDRIVLVTSTASPKPLKEDLRNVLKRVGQLAPRQNPESAAVNADQRKALKVVVSQAERRWQAVTGTAPTEDEIRKLLSLFAIEILDVEVDVVNEREAKRILTSVVLENPGQIEVAWSTIVVACTQMAQDRSGLDLASLQRKLEDSGIPLRSLLSYRKDIDRLKSHTAITLGLLADLSHIQVGGKPLHIDRVAIHELRHAVEKGSHLVVGQPGAGKSGVLHDLTELLRNDGDVVCLAADRLETSSLFNLKNEIGLEHDIPDLLTHWHGSKPGYLVIDALDAARGSSAEQALLSLVQAVVRSKSRWRVVASIRKFDLRYSLDLQQLFRQQEASAVSPDFLDGEFSLLRHVNIPCLSMDEVNSFRSSAPMLHQLFQDATAEFREILRVPFNLRLVADLLQSGVHSEELAPIRTQLQLLDRYWLHRIVQNTGGDDREAILRRAVEVMVQERQLKVERSRALGSGSTVALENLLSSHVLVEWQPSASMRPDRYSLAFSHNLLFDYAVTRLLLRRTGTDVIDMLQQDPDLVLVIRPSLLFLCQETWEQDRDAFWNLAFLFSTSSGLPELAQAIPMSIVAANAKTSEDVQQLLSALCSNQDGAETAFVHLVGILRSQPRDSRPLTGSVGGPWSEFLEAMTKC